MSDFYSNDLVSVITPTFNRPFSLSGAYSIFSSQTFANREWIVVDDSDEPSAFMQNVDDPRVRYIFLNERTSTGNKRNIAISASNGYTIVQFDDDDYYSPDYISQMVRQMNNLGADFVKQSSFFIYSISHDIFAYWDLLVKNRPLYMLSPTEDPRLIMPTDSPEWKDIHLGYGFSYVFKRKVWDKTPFEDKYWNQDTPFIKSAIRNGYHVNFISDQYGLSLHNIHQKNSSSSFAQYIIPAFIRKILFPAYD